MRIFARKLAANFLSKDGKKKLKSLEKKVKKNLSLLRSPLQPSHLRNILVNELEIREGDTVMVHASLSLLGQQLNAETVKNILLDIIGPNGNLVVPTFSPKSGEDYLANPSPFFVEKTRSGMGALAEIVRKSNGARRSIHPTKSVAVIGPQSDIIVSGHEECVYPFDIRSPFGRLLQLNARIIGIGVPMSYLSFVHVPEDMHPEQVQEDVWDPRTLSVTCHDGDRSINVQTRVHNMATMARANPEKFCRRHLRPGQFKSLKVRGVPFFSVRSQDLYQKIKQGFLEGFSIYD